MDISIFVVPLKRYVTIKGTSCLNGGNIKGIDGVHGWGNGPCEDDGDIELEFDGDSIKCGSTYVVIKDANR